VGSGGGGVSRAFLTPGAVGRTPGPPGRIQIVAASCSPGRTIWKIATSAKKDTGPATGQIDQIVLLLGAADVAASKRFYVDRGLAVAKSFGRKYVEFATPSSPVKLALYGRRALAKDAGVSPDGTGSHLLMIGSDAGPFTDPDGFAWEEAPL
jgi:hypothetical protein